MNAVPFRMGPRYACRNADHTRCRHDFGAAMLHGIFQGRTGHWFILVGGIGLSDMGWKLGGGKCILPRQDQF